ncbi:MAG: DAK2 domain-containing protein [Actinomycetota bacterium]|nr:DAK2 domain-containing protein [Actinomycetota bacterium]
METARATPLERLRPEDLRSVMSVYRDALRAHQDVVNRLNVYPVPDGDTGTNMALTVESVVSAMDGAQDMTTTCQAIARGSLMGARGNSGVILSQILRGVSERCREAESAGPGDVAEALAVASEAAYQAVMRPVEGTILTVVRAAAEGAGEAAGRGKALVDVLDAARNTAADVLERTPEMLPVLKQAGVVDAGGAGFVLFLDALLHVVAGRAVPPPEAAEGAPGDGAGAPASAGRRGGGPAGDEEQSTALRYEVMYLLEAPDEAVDAFKQAWAAIGDSIVVVGGDGVWNCHIHTDDIGAAVEAALECGRPRDIRVTDLRDQVEEERCLREADAGPPAEERAEQVPTAVVAVAAGEGIQRIFRSLGARTVTGGPSMNPSTAEILEAVEAAPAQHVVVLPNDKNVVPVAEAVEALTAKTVRVVRTTSVPEGLAALLEHDPQGDADQNAEAMSEAAGRVVWGEVTQAVRATGSDAGRIDEGDWLGLSAGGIEVVAATLVDAATGLLEKLVASHHEVVTVVEGEGASEGATSALRDWLGEHRPGVTVEIHHGGQPHYPYLVSVE